ncbi:MAG: hypothetical protein ACK4ND_18425 [Cytophagaceae bacterium]
MEENKNTPNSNDSSDQNNPQNSSGAGRPQRPGSGDKRKAEKAENEKSGVDAVKIILIVLVVGLLGGLGYLLFNTQEQITVIKAQDERIHNDSLLLVKNNLEIDRLVAHADSLMKEYEALGIKTDDLEKQIAELENLRDQLQKRANRADWLQGELNKVRRDLQAKDALIAKLKLQVDTLEKDNEVLNKEKLALGDTLKGLKSLKVTLEEKVAIASILKSDQANVSAFTSKGKEITKQPYKAKAVDNLKVSFRLMENKVAEPGNRFFALRLIEPDGSVLFDMGTGGGTFKSGEKEMFYTLSQEKNYDNAKQNITFVYKKGSPYKSGKHTVELYADGEKVGESIFQVK